MTDTSMKDVLDPTGGSATLVDAAETVVSRIATIEDAKGAANGLASLNSSGKLAQTVDGANVNQDSTHRFATDTEKTYWDGKLDAPTIHGATEKTTPVDADEMGIVDSEASNILKKLTWANLKATLYAQLANVANGFIGIVYVDTWANCLASKPAASNSGKFILVTDRYNGALYRSNGTCYDRVGGGPIVDDTSTNIAANYAAASYPNALAYATDLKQVLKSNGSAWRIYAKGTLIVGYDDTEPWRIFMGCSGDTYSQDGTTVTVTTANGLPSALYNGAKVYLNQNTGLLTSGWFTNYQYVDATHYTVTSSVSRSDSGSLGANTTETFLDKSFTLPPILLQRGNYWNPIFARFGKANGNAKTTKIYVDGTQTDSSNIGSSGIPAIMNPNSPLMLTDTKWQLNNVAGGPYDVGAMVYTVSHTFATATDWAAYWPRGFNATVYNG